MCRICEDFEVNKDGKQAYQNLFEVKEQVGVEHAKEIVAMVDLNLDFDTEGKTVEGRQIAAIKEFITPEPEPELDRSQL